MNFRRPQARQPSLIGRRLAKIPKRPNSTIAGGRRGEPRAMAVIDIFEENHRFSAKTPPPGPHSVVDAANPATRQPREREIF